MAKKSKKKEPTWDEIGKNIGEKIEKGAKNKEITCWSWCGKSNKGGNFFAALVFAITALWAIGQMGYATDVLPWWIKGILIVSFAIMFS